MVICSAENVADLYEEYNGKYERGCRLIVVDVSLSSTTLEKGLTKKTMDDLVNDIHLLVDIYWLDEVWIEVESKVGMLCEKINAKLHGRMRFYPKLPNE
jgi:hypothetical protein